MDAPAFTLGLGDTCTTSRRLRTRRFATVEAATRLAWLCSDLAAAAPSNRDLSHQLVPKAELIVSIGQVGERLESCVAGAGDDASTP
jgi:hypothetical protein